MSSRIVGLKWKSVNPAARPLIAIIGFFYSIFSSDKNLYQSHVVLIKVYKLT